MSDSVVLELLRAIPGDITEMKLDLKDVKQRMTALEIAMANFAASETSHYASLSSRMDRIEDRVERVERRLEPA